MNAGRSLSKTLIVVAGIVLLIQAIPAGADVIRPIAATSDTVYTFYAIDHTIDNSGLASPLNTGDAVPQDYPYHAPESATGTTWLSANGASGAETVIYQLAATDDDTVDISGFHLWNYNNVWKGNAYSYRGMSSANVSVSADGLTWSTPTAMIFSLAPADAAACLTYAGEDYTLNAQSIRFVKFDDMQSSDAYVGLSEIRFVGAAVPEPATMAMLGLGGVMMLVRRRRQR